MDSKLKTEQIHIEGMTCVNCQNKIEKTLNAKAGIHDVKVSYNAGIAKVTYDSRKISMKDIYAVIEKLDYTVIENKAAAVNISHIIFYLAVILVLYMLLEHFGILNLLVPSALADTTMGYGMLFVIGLITSVHCIAMCGGINLSQCIPRNSRPEMKSCVPMPPVLYNLGRVISYTAVGFLLGFIGMLFGGSSENGLPVILQGLLKLFAGCFMIIMGLNMLNIFPQLRRFGIRMPDIVAKKINKETSPGRQPFFTGLLNGLMPCGPLQSMQLVALASGNPFSGALSMLVFSLGTVPLMLGLGSVISALGKKFTHSITKIGAVLVVVLGLAMLSQGGRLSGLFASGCIILFILALGIGYFVSELFALKRMHKAVRVFVSVFVAWAVFISGHMRMPEFNADTVSEPNIKIVNGEQVVRSTLSSGSYPNIVVQVGIPVKWIIDAPKGSINGCNNSILIHEYGIEYTFKTGENVITFTPSDIGQFRYSCWMGMIHGNITVT